MWTPDVVFENQVSLNGAADAIKNESDAVVEVLVLGCSSSSSNQAESSCERKKIRFKRTVRVGVNCPDMNFDDFPFDKQNCDFLLKDVTMTENATNYFRWDTAIVKQKKALISNEYDLSGCKATANRSGFHLNMARKSTVYIYTYFVPCGLMVMVSWISFAVRVDAVPGRWWLFL